MFIKQIVKSLLRYNVLRGFVVFVIIYIAQFFSLLRLCSLSTKLYIIIKEIASFSNQIGKWSQSANYYKHYINATLDIHNPSLENLQYIIKCGKNYERIGEWKKSLLLMPWVKEDAILVKSLSKLISDLDQFVNVDNSDYIDKYKKNVYDSANILLSINKPTSILYFPFWLAIYRLLFYSGFIKLAYLAKKQGSLCCISDVHSNEEIPTRLKFWMFSSDLFLENSEKAEHSLKLIKDTSKSKSDRLFAIKLMAVLLNNNFDSKMRESYRSETSAKYYPEDFIEIIKNKTIAFVGPAETNQYYGEEIDSFDIVIRPNITLNIYDTEYQKKYGKKTDIVYINILNDRLNRKIIKSFLVQSKCKYLVVRNRGMLNSYKNIIPTRLDSPIVVHEFFQPLAMIRIIADLLPLEPKIIKVFGVDFFAGKQFYNKSYISSNSSQRFKKESFYQLAADDPLISVIIAKKILNNSKIQMSPEAYSVLCMSLNEYIEALEEGSSSFAPLINS